MRNQSEAIASWLLELNQTETGQISAITTGSSKIVGQLAMDRTAS